MRGGCVWALVLGLASAMSFVDRERRDTENNSLNDKDPLEDAIRKLVSENTVQLKKNRSQTADTSIMPGERDPIDIIDALKRNATLRQALTRFLLETELRRYSNQEQATNKGLHSFWIGKNPFTEMLKTQKANLEKKSLKEMELALAMEQDMQLHRNHQNAEEIGLHSFYSGRQNDKQTNPKKRHGTFETAIRKLIMQRYANKHKEKSRLSEGSRMSVRRTKHKTVPQKNSSGNVNMLIEKLSEEQLNKLYQNYKRAEDAGLHSFWKGDTNFDTKTGEYYYGERKRNWQEALDRLNMEEALRSDAKRQIAEDNGLHSYHREM